MNPTAFIETAAATRSAMLRAMAHPGHHRRTADVAALLRSLRAR